MMLTGPTLMQASGLGQQWAGVEHLLLALLDPARPSLAGEILSRQGLDYESYRAQFENLMVGGTPADRSSIETGRSTSPNPRYYGLAGWVEGFAAAHGAEPSPELALVGICWLDRPPMGSGLDRDAIVAALREAGVPLPATELPSWEPEGPPEHLIWVRHDQISAAIRRLQDAGILRGFNTDSENEQAWVTVDHTPAVLDQANQILGELLDPHAGTGPAAEGR